MESCGDGIQNQDENGVDCGGPCKPCPSCQDGAWNQDEEGVDCGGPCQPCQKTRSIFGRITVPPEVKAGDEFVLLVEVKATGDVFQGVVFNLNLPQTLSTAKPLNQTLGVLKPGDVVHLTWVVHASEDVPSGEYPVEVSIQSPVYETVNIRESIKIYRVTFTKMVREGVYTFIENSVSFVTENPVAITLPLTILFGLGYLYYRMRR